MILFALFAIISMGNAEEDRIEIDFQVAKDRNREKSSNELIEPDWNQGRGLRTELPLPTASNIDIEGDLFYPRRILTR